MSILLNGSEIEALEIKHKPQNGPGSFMAYSRAIQLALIEKMRKEPVGYRWKGSDEPDSKWRLCRGPEQVKNLDLPGTKIELLHILPTPQELENES